MVFNQEGSSMKKLAILSMVLLAAFILLPESSNGKYNVSKSVVADGTPLPWPIPPSGDSSVVCLCHRLLQPQAQPLWSQMAGLSLSRYQART
jgi:hypothetical protein